MASEMSGEDGGEVIYQCEHMGSPFLMTPSGCHRALWMRHSFSLEHHIREAWWLIKPDDVVLDVGAGFGSYSLPALAKGARVIALEPAKEEFFSLCQNVAINRGFSQRFTGLPLIAGHAGLSEVDFCEAMHTCLETTGTSEKRMPTSIDVLASDLFPDKLDWLKVDVEGMEVSVLTGAINTICLLRPRVLVECHAGIDAGIPQAVAQIMVAFGYWGETKTGKGGNDHWTLWTPNKG